MGFNHVNMVCMALCLLDPRTVNAILLPTIPGHQRHYIDSYFTSVWIAK